MSEVWCRELEKSFGGVNVVERLTLQITPGEIMALLGPSGCGKTTVLRMIAGFERPDRGTIQINERIVAEGRKIVAPEQRRVGMVFQHHALFPHLPVAENVGFGLRGSRSSRQERIQAMLDLVGMSGLGNRMPHQLSGGQQQRVALARALAPQPEVLLLDEPFSNLDADLRTSMRGHVRDILKQVGTTAIFVTHDQEEALFMGDRVAIMQAGRLEQVAAPQELFLAPASRFVAEFLGITTFLPAQVTSKGLQTEIGNLAQSVSVPLGSQVEVVVRPDDLALAADPSGNGRIAGRTFRGGEYLYEVALDSDQIIRCLSNHVHNYPPGTRVHVVLAPGHDLAYFPKPSREQGIPT